MLDELTRNIAYTFRTLRREAGFATFAILIAGLGIGAGTTVFSVVNAILLRPLPFANSNQLAWIGNRGLDGKAEWAIQSDHLIDLRARMKSFSGLAGYFGFNSPGDNRITGDGDPVRLNGVQVTCNFFPLLEVKPVYGRQFSEDECKWKGSGAVLLSYGLWKSRYNADPSVVGRRIVVNKNSVNVVGVMPESFDFGSVFEPGSHVDVFSPFPVTEETSGWGNTLSVVGRLKPGATIAGAQAEFTLLGRQLERDYPKRNTIRPIVRSLDEHVNGRFRPALWALACAVGVVMLIVCANLANLQIARAATRQKELAIRVAVGAGRALLIRQMLTESVILACCGIVPGLLIAVLGTSALAHLRSFNIPLLSSVRVDATALGFTIALALLTGLIVGLAAALQAPAVAIYETLKEGARGTSSGSHAWIRGTLVVAAIAFASVLLTGTGLLVRSFVHVLDVNLGFQPERAAALRIDPVAQFSNIQERYRFLGDVLRVARGTPGIGAAAITDTLPFDSGERSGLVEGVGQNLPLERVPETFQRFVSDGYLKTAGIAIVSGRDFTEHDTPMSEPVAIVNQTLARVLWPGQNPIGQMLAVEKPRRVIAVVEDTLHRSLEEAPGGEMYLPMRQRDDLNNLSLLVRTAMPPEQAGATLRAALRPLDPGLGTGEFRTLQSLVDQSASPRRFLVLLLSGFSAFALVLAALGIYALIAYSVNQRTREFGIRMALGAGAFDLQTRVLAGTLALAAVGVTLGVAASWLLGRSLTSMLFGVTATDPTTFGAMVAVLGGAALIAGYLPARRASRIDPMTALRID